MSRKLLMCGGKNIGYLYNKYVSSDKSECIIDVGEELTPAFNYAYLLEAKGKTSFPGSTMTEASRNTHQVAEYNPITGKYDYTIISSSYDGDSTKSVTFSLTKLLDEVDRTTAYSDPKEIVSDRMYWDETEGEYMIEVKTKHEIHHNSDEWNVNSGNGNIITKELDTTITLIPSDQAYGIPVFNSNYKVVSWNDRMLVNGSWGQCTVSYNGPTGVCYAHMLRKSASTATKDEVDSLFSIPMHLVYAVDTEIIRTGIKKKIKVPLFGNQTKVGLQHVDTLYNGISITGTQTTYGSIKLEIPCMDKVVYTTFEGEGISLTPPEGFTVDEKSKIYFERFDGKVTEEYSNRYGTTSEEYIAIGAYRKFITLGERIDDNNFLFKIKATSADGSQSKTIDMILPDMVCPYSSTSTDPKCYVEWSDIHKKYVYYSNSEYVLLDNLDTFKYGPFREAFVRQYNTWVDKRAWRTPVMPNIGIVANTSVSTSSVRPRIITSNAGISEPYYVGRYAQNPIITWSSQAIEGGYVTSTDEDKLHTFTMVVKSKEEGSDAIWYDDRSLVNEHLRKWPVEIIMSRLDPSKLTPILTDIGKQIELPYFGPGTTYSLEKENTFGVGEVSGSEHIPKQVANIKIKVPLKPEHVIVYKEIEGTEVILQDNDMSLSRYDKPAYIKEISGVSILDVGMSEHYGYVIEYYNPSKPNAVKKIQVRLTDNPIFEGPTKECSSLIWDDTYGCYMIKYVSGYNFTYTKTNLTNKIEIPLFSGRTAIKATSTSTGETATLTIEAPVEMKDISIPAPSYELPTPTYFTGSSSATAPHKAYIDTGVKLFDTQKDFTIYLEYEPYGTPTTAGTPVIHCRYNSGNYRGLALTYDTTYSGWRLYGNTGVNSGNLLDSTTASISDTNPIDNNWHYRILIRFKNGLPDRIINLQDGKSDSEVAGYNNFKDYQLWTDTSGNAYPAWASHTRNLLLGCYETTSGSRSKYYKGWIYQCKVWNGTALTDEQIQYMFDGPVPYPSVRIKNHTVSSAATCINTGIAMFQSNAHNSVLGGSTIIIDFLTTIAYQPIGAPIIHAPGAGSITNGVGLRCDSGVLVKCGSGVATVDEKYRVKLDGQRGVMILQFKHYKYSTILDRVIEATDGILKEIPIKPELVDTPMGSWSNSYPITIGCYLSSEVTMNTSYFWTGTINDCMIWNGTELSDTQLEYVLKYMLGK